MIDREQLSAYVEGLLDAAERARIEALLAADADALREVAGQRDMDCLLRSVLLDERQREAVKQSILVAARAPALDRLKSRVLRETSARDKQARATRFLTPVWWGLAMACVALGLWLWLPREDRAPLIAARLAEIEGRVFVTRDAVELTPADGCALKSGDAIRVGEGARAAVRFADATQLELELEATLTLDSAGDAGTGKRLAVSHGTVIARATPQLADRPLVIATPHARVTVMGTLFLLRVQPRATRVEVAHGEVRVAHADGGEAIRVAAGQFVQVGRGAPLRADQLPSSNTDDWFGNAVTKRRAPAPPPVERKPNP
jgi:anti-sigma factor RsiW